MSRFRQKQGPVVRRHAQCMVIGLSGVVGQCVLNVEVVPSQEVDLVRTLPQTMVVILVKGTPLKADLVELHPAPSMERGLHGNHGLLVLLRVVGEIKIEYGNVTILHHNTVAKTVQEMQDKAENAGRHHVS